MPWSEQAPQTGGRFKWRLAPGARVHNVIVKVRRGVVEVKCKTMDLRSVMASGEWMEVGTQTGVRDQTEAEQWASL